MRGDGMRAARFVVAPRRPHTSGYHHWFACGPQAREERVWRPKMAETLEEVTGSLVAELEARFPYAAALISSASGVQINDNGNEQEASEETPSRGAVFTVYDGGAFVE